MRQVYVNGQYLPETEAKVSVFDRGFLFADAIYEVTAVVGGKLIDFAGHIARLHRSLKALDLKVNNTDEELLTIHRELITRNQLQEGLIYFQITRGVADRNFLFPPADTPNTIVLFTQALPLLNSPLAQRGAKVITAEDLRWGRCDIKTVQLLYASMIKTAAQQQNADDAWLVRDGLVTEGTSNNAYIVTETNQLITHHLSSVLLPGTTRNNLMATIAQMGLTVEERPFSLEEALIAKEAFITSSGVFVTAVVSIDGHVIGDGAPGSISRQLREAYVRHCLANAI